MADLLFDQAPYTFAEHVRIGKMIGSKNSYKSVALQKRERAGVKQSEQPVKLLDERTCGRNAKY